MADMLTQAERSREVTTEDMLLCCLCNSLVAEPALLLQCLHSCCARCIVPAVTASPHDGSDITTTQRPQGAPSLSVTCPKCQEVTGVAAVARHGLLSAMVRLLKADGSGSSSGSAGLGSARSRNQCDFCLEDGIAKQSAEHWCGDCHRYLCGSCLLAHNKFNKQHVAVSMSAVLVDPASATVEPSTGAAQCASHNASQELFCFTCETLRCVACEDGRSCLDLAHDLGGARGSRVSDLVRCLLMEVQVADDELRRRRTQLSTASSEKALLAELSAAKQARLDAITANKRLLLDVIERAFSKTKDELTARYDGMVAEAAEASRALRLLECRVDHSLAYADALLSTAVRTPSAAAPLLAQLRNLLRRLQALADECRVRPLASASLSAAAGRVTLDVEQPSELESIVARCIGVVRQLPAVQGVSARPSESRENRLDSGFASMLFDRVSHSSSPTSSQASTLLTADDGDRVTVPSYVDAEPKFGLAGRTPAEFRAKVKCWDLAIAQDGSVLLAAYADGLRQYDATGRELSCWLPPPCGDGSGAVAAEESVYTVDALADGRVAVGLLKSRSVVVLRRLRPLVVGDTGDGGSSSNRGTSGPGDWAEELRVGLRAQPWRLACQGDLVAVTYARSERRKYVPGPSLDLLSLSDRSVRLSRTQSYNVVALAVTEQSVLAASDRQHLSTDTSSCWYIVDSFSHQGVLLWRHECDESIFDIAAEPLGQLTYLAVGDSRRVIAIHGEDGHETTEVLPPSASGPVRLSLCQAGRHSALAVLLFDLKSVCVYSS